MNIANPGATRSCAVRAGLPGGMNILYHNNGDGTFTDVSEKAGILKPGPRYSITAVSYDFDNDGWPDIYVAVDSEPSILFHNNHDGTFSDIAVMAGCGYSQDGNEQAGMGVAVGTTIATDGSTSSKRISPTTHRTYIEIMATGPLRK